MEGHHMNGAPALAALLLAASGISHMNNENISEMTFVLDSHGVYGSAPPLVLEIDETGHACAVNLSHDLQQDMTQRVFTGIGKKCLRATSDLREKFNLLRSLVAKETSTEPGRGVHFLKYTLGKGPGQQSGTLALRPRTEATSEASKIFYSLHFEISVNGKVDAGIRPELHLHNGHVVELLIHNIGRENVSITSPREWADSDDPLVPNVTASIWSGNQGVVALLGPDSWRSAEEPEDRIEILAGETVSLEFNLPREIVEEVERFPDAAQIAGDLRFHVHFENGPSGMATAAIDSKQIKLSR